MHASKFLPLVLLMAAAQVAYAQDDANSTASTVEPAIYVGMGTGFDVSTLHYSNLDKELFPKNKANFSGEFSVFAELDFGNKHEFAIRPQFSFLTRGGRISQIGRNYYENYSYDASDPAKLDDVSYRLKATYLDFRLPFIYQFLNDDSKIRPYAYLAPIFGFANNGYVESRYTYADNSYTGYKYDLSKANMNSFYFALALGIGAKYQFKINDETCFVGLEMNYQFGCNNTYSKAEKKGTVSTVTSFFESSGKVDGSRRINSFELAATVGIPLSIFTKSKKQVVAPVEEEIVEEVEEEPVVTESPCNTLEEVIYMLNHGISIEGKTICAIDDNINFEFASSEINESSYEYLDQLADLFKNTNMNVRVSGHTDNIGSAEFNMDLSRKRALAVVEYLENKGVDSTKIAYTWYGLSRPIATNDTEAGRKQNRRVEFEILK